MARADIITKLYSKSRSALEFNYDKLVAPPIYSLFTQTDTGDLAHIAKSVALSSKIDKKKQMITEIMARRGFKFFASGTNRMVYKFLEDQSFVAKVAFDRVGIKDNPSEMKNQLYIKPYCCKCFECTQDGALGFMERVQPITSRAEFISIADDIYDLVNEKLIGKYVIEDIGTKYFMNFGLRLGWGPVIIDYPYIYKLDGDKLYCNSQDPITGEPCLGEIDYDDGFNELHCEKCGRLYKAKELADLKENNEIIQEGRHNKMKVVITNAEGKTIGTVGNSDAVISKKNAPRLEHLKKNIITPIIKDANGEIFANSCDFTHEIAEAIKREAMGEDILKAKPEDEVKSSEEESETTDSDVVIVHGRPVNSIASEVVSEEEVVETDPEIEEVVDDENKIMTTLEENSEEVSEVAEKAMEEEEVPESEIDKAIAKSENDMVDNMIGNKNQKRSRRFDPEYYAKN